MLLLMKFFLLCVPLSVLVALVLILKDIFFSGLGDVLSCIAQSRVFHVKKKNVKLSTI